MSTWLEVLIGVAAYLVTARAVYWVLAKTGEPAIMAPWCSHDYQALHRGQPCHPVSVSRTRNARVMLALTGPVAASGILVGLMVAGVAALITWKQPATAAELKEKHARLKEAVAAAERDLEDATRAARIARGS